ncbi:MAG: hypothetical protein HY438_02575 [DPANN group archaeon]|nr:hypothetical protein [DPANN group archaeon]
MKVSPFEEVKVLDQVKPGIYKTKKLADGVSLKSKEVIKQASSVILAARACDGMFYRINSDIAETLSKNADLLKKGYINAVLEEALPLNGVHGSRFVIFHPKNTDQAFLLGDVQTALKKLTKVSL